MAEVAFLDESKTPGRHRIISVGGFVAEATDIPAIEQIWRDGKESAGLDPDKPIKHSGDWPDQEPRTRLIELIGGMPIRAVIALLEDFRPDSYQQVKRLRSELFIHKPAFDYVLQRLASIYFKSEGPHFVSFDLRDDFSELSKLFAQAHGRDWKLTYSTIPSMRSIGVGGSLLASNAGPANEIADFVASSFTRWTGARCEAQRKTSPVIDLSEQDRCARALAPLFPVNPGSGTRRGFSIVTHTQQRTGKELLRRHLDGWIDALLDDDEIPF
jgi:hypothetical protein